MTQILNSTSRPFLGAMLLLAMVACGGSAPATTSTGAAAPAPSRAVSVTDGESLIRAMHARYDGRWPKTLTFIQTTELMTPGATASTDQVWYQAFAIPGRLRIDYVNPDLGNGLLFTGDSSFQFVNGRMARAASGWNDLLILTQDVYAQSPEVTVSVLRALGIQMSRLRTQSFDGRSAYVVGSSSVTDSASKQFWIERDRLVLVRLRERRADGQFTDIRLGNFKPMREGFIATEAYQFLNGIPRLHQRVSNIQPDSALDPALFDPRKWGEVKHWTKR